MTSAPPRESKARERLARAAMASRESEDSVSLFVSHHLEELQPSYWAAHFSTPTPTAAKVLQSLVLVSTWGDAHPLQHFDFSLPGEVTNYVLSVEFDAAGSVVGIEMES